MIDDLLRDIGIKPIWEDPANKRGGKWIVRLRKGLASRFVGYSLPCFSRILHASAYDMICDI